MAFAGNQTQIVTIRTILQGQICTNVLEYGTEDSGNYADPEDFGTSWIAGNQNDWLACLSEDASMLDITFSTTHPTGVPAYAPFIASINLPGAVASEALPPHVSYRVYKVPDNANVEGVLNDNFRLGATRISGVPESFQSSGIITLAAKGLLETLVAGMVAITTTSAVSGSVDFNLLMVRRETGTSNFGLTKVFNYVVQSTLGSQNTRKL